MFFDIKDKLITDDYIPALKIIRDFYFHSHQAFEDEIEKLSMPYKNNLDKVQAYNNEAFDIEDDENYQKIIHLKNFSYTHLSSCLQSIVSLWENQLNDFYLLENYRDYNLLKIQLLNDGYYDLDSDKKIKEIRYIDNYLKHGEFGEAATQLKNMNSKYFKNNNMFGEMRGIYLRNKQLDITINDIKTFSNTFIDFWNVVLSKLK